MTSKRTTSIAPGAPGVEDLHAHKDDPKEWSEEESEVQVRPTTSSVVSFRIPHSELDALLSVVEARGESLSGFVRDAVRLRLGHLAGTPTNAADEPNAIATVGAPEAEVVARIDGIAVPEVIRTALAAHIAARRQDPAFQARLRQEQTLLRSLAE